MVTRERRLFISFSGGETSAFMVLWCLNNWKDKYDKIVVLFANTGQENEETLEFVRNFADHFGIEVIWIEAISQEMGKSPKPMIVDFASANRDGRVFEEMIMKFGIPNKVYTHCTKELKLRPMENYIKDMGWERGSYDTAVGIRSDEIDRMSSEAEKRRIVYPLVTSYPVTKPQINQFWMKQPFRLGLKGYQGNCKWCWKKSLRKHLTLISERPEIYDFPRRMEQKYDLVGSEFSKADKDRPKPLPEGYRRVFFREGRSTDDLFAEYEARKANFEPAVDDALELPPPLFDSFLDISDGCAESCEVFADE